MNHDEPQGDTRSDEWVMRPDLARRYRAALHAVQAGVGFEQARDPQGASPKHLRVGINSALVSHAALVKLLYAHGFFSRDEYDEALVQEMEAEVQRYTARLQQALGGDTTLKLV